MVHIERISAANLAAYRRVRLAALKDSPLAFGSTFADETKLSDADWDARAKWLDGSRAAGFLAIEDSAACGVALGFIDETNDSEAHLVSMWVAPEKRRFGVGRALVERVVEWARSRDVETVKLMVTSSNDAAIWFYSKLGFTNTGRTEPYPNDAALLEFEMSRTVGGHRKFIA
jgi:ribosomal protein S18 acetylase RimI-like enzyme